MAALGFSALLKDTSAVCRVLTQGAVSLNRYNAAVYTGKPSARFRLNKPTRLHTHTHTHRSSQAASLYVQTQYVTRSSSVLRGDSLNVRLEAGRGAVAAASRRAPSLSVSRGFSAVALETLLYEHSFFVINIWC